MSWDAWIQLVDADAACIAGHDGTVWGVKNCDIDPSDIISILAGFSEGKPVSEAFVNGLHMSKKNYIFIHGDERRVFAKSGLASLVAIATARFILIAIANTAAIVPGALISSAESVADRLVVAMGGSVNEKWGEGELVLTKFAGKA